MTDEERNDAIAEIIDEACARMVADGLVEHDLAALRAMTFHAFGAMPRHLCGAHLAEDMKRFRNWFDHEINRLQPQ